MIDAADASAPPTIARAGQALSSRPVVCVSHGFQTSYERGFCNGLAAQGVALTLVSSDRSDRAGLSPAVRCVNLRGSQAENRPRWRKAANLLRYHASLVLYSLWRRRATWHVIGLPEPLLWCGIVEGLWLRIVCRRYLLTVHDVLPHEQHHALARSLCWLAYRMPHALVVHTGRAKQRLVEEFGLPAERIVVMEHGIEPAAATATPDPVRATGEPPLLLAFGIVVPRKGIDLLLDALRGLSFAFRLTIAGHCPDAAYRRRLQAMLADHPHRNQIDWRDGFVSETEMEALFHNAALLVLPYRYIEQSGVLFQALRFGLPVLGTRVGQFECYITPEVGVLADAPRADALREALERWAAARAGYSRQRIRQIGQAFEWPATVTALRAVYTPEGETAAHRRGAR